MVAVMFVCLGNICRSPAGEELLRQKAKRAGIIDLEVASSGLGSWHIGELPNPPMREAASRKGYTLTSRAQQFHPRFFQEYDIILAADHEVFRDLKKQTEDPEEQKKIVLMTHYGSQYRDQEIPDPYYDGPEAFDHVLDMLEDACDGLIQYLSKSPQHRSKEHNPQQSL